ncbi:MAG TPA: DegT/DnrJ/EryC1/StrS family aminotransferase [Desulfosarcina sp.]|nr:DegT/DnrJ/EryC1/StrS family aminotransferase [Desulfosarcina sp.]
MIPQTDPRAGYREHREEIDAALRRVIESGRYILGEEVRAFEQEFAARIGCAHAIGVASGTDALRLALKAIGVGAGDLVFTVAHTAVATVAAIELAGATPVLVDVAPGLFTMDPDSLESALENPPPGTPKAVIPVHLYGQPADMPAIRSLADRHGVRIVEDCAQCHGAALDGRLAGAWGDLAAFSFYPTKNLGAIGDGGMIVTDNGELAESVRLLQQYGWRQRYVSEVAGGNSRLDELQAAVLRVKLRHLDSDNDRRAALAERYDVSFAETPLVLPAVRKGARHVFHQYAVCCRQRDALMGFLARHGIGTLVHYPVPVHLQPAYARRLPSTVTLRNTEDIAHQVLSLPMFPQLSEQQSERVCDAVLQFTTGRRVD